MAATPSSTKNTTTVSGKAVLKESGVGIPNLVVMIFQSNSETTDGTSAAKKTREKSVGSALTDANGRWMISFDDSDVKGKATDAKRPSLFVSVRAPDDADSKLDSVVFFKSKVSRQGRRESFCVNISAEKLNAAGLKAPGEEKESVENNLKNYIRQSEEQNELEDGITNYHKANAEKQREVDADFRKKFKKTFSVEPEDDDSNGYYVKEGEIIKEHVVKAFHKKMELINDQLGNKKRGVPVSLYLTPADREKLAEYFERAVDGVAEIPESVIRPILFRSENSENIGTLLVNNNPIAKYCKERTSEEIGAKELLQDSDHHNPAGGNVTSSNITTITSGDMPTYIARLIGNMPSPDAVMDPSSLPSRPDQDAVASSINSFGLKKGPAEVAAYYDFNSLQIAFDHVWQLLFDEEMINAAQRLHKKVLNKTGVNAVEEDKFSMVKIETALSVSANEVSKHIPANVVTHFDIVKEEWNDLPHRLQEKLKKIAAALDDSMEIKVEDRGFWGSRFPVMTIDALSKEKYFQALAEQGERIIDSVRHDDYYTMHKTLRDLHRRINSKYEYTVFAADKDHCSVNFGILNTYRQEWLPLNYQVGKLCKTIALSPKEERKYSLKITKHTKRSEKDTSDHSRQYTVTPAEYTPQLFEALVELRFETL